MFDRILTFWRASQAHWWRKSPTFDDTVRARFGGIWQEACEGLHRGWSESPEGRLALVIVLDQFSRNLCREDPGAWAQDAEALRITREGLEDGYDQALDRDLRVFAYMPLEHSEDLADQERSVALFEAHGDAMYLDFAQKHRDIVARFGRFPHRNAVLGRESTPEELDFLKQPGSSF